MEKISKSQILGKTFITIFFFSLHISFIISLLNPQMPVKTGTALFLLFYVFIFSSIFLGIFIYLIFKKFYRYSDLIFLIFCFLVLLIYLIEKNLHPLFFHPLLFKLLDKGIWASSITFLGIIFLRNHKRVLIFLLIASAVFLYQRRDERKFRKSQAFPVEIELKGKPKCYLLVQETKIMKNFLEDMKENENLDNLKKILEEGSRGAFKVYDYLKGDVLKTTIFTGTFPYTNRNFGKYSNVFIPIYDIDLYPFFFPKILKKEKKEFIPYIWDILKNYKIPVEVSGIKNLENAKNDDAIFFINLIESSNNEDEILNEKINEINSKLNEEDYFCLILPQKGFFYIKGKEIKKGVLITSMKIVDPIPTILFLYNLPLSNYLSGRVLSECIKEEYLKENPVGIIGKY